MSGRRYTSRKAYWRCLIAIEVGGLDESRVDVSGRWWRRSSIGMLTVDVIVYSVCCWKYSLGLEGFI